MWRSSHLLALPMMVGVACSGGERTRPPSTARVPEPRGRSAYTASGSDEAPREAEDRRQVVVTLDPGVLVSCGSSVTFWANPEATPQLLRVSPPILKAQLVGGQYFLLDRAGQLWCWGAKGVDGSEQCPEVFSQRVRIADQVQDFSGECWIRAGAVECLKGRSLADGHEATTWEAAPVQDAAGRGLSANRMSRSQGDCAIDDRGHTQCWGKYASWMSSLCASKREAWPELEKDWTPEAVAIPMLDGLREMSARLVFACGVTAASEAVCFGCNSHGQLGIAPKDYGPSAAALESSWEVVRERARMCGTASMRGGSCDAGPTYPLGTLRVRELHCGRVHCCAVDEFGKVHCWGANDRAQIGKGNVTPWEPASPVALPRPVIGLGVMVTGGCALTDQLDLWCWGAGVPDVLGSGSGATNMLPHRVATNLACE